MSDFSIDPKILSIIQVIAETGLLCLDLCSKAEGLNGNLRSAAHEQVRFQATLVTR
jgi:hypothetical protein